MSKRYWVVGSRLQLHVLSRLSSRSLLCCFDACFTPGAGRVVVPYREYDSGALADGAGSLSHSTRRSRETMRRSWNGLQRCSKT